MSYIFTVHNLDCYFSPYLIPKVAKEKLEQSQFLFNLIQTIDTKFVYSKAGWKLHIDIIEITQKDK